MNAAPRTAESQNGLFDHPTLGSEEFEEDTSALLQMRVQKPDGSRSKPLQSSKYLQGGLLGPDEDVDNVELR